MPDNNLHEQFRECFGDLPAGQQIGTYCLCPQGGGVAAGYKNPDIDFGIQVLNGTCYILWIEVAALYRRKGIGRSVVSRIEKFARLHGCKILEATPSGMGCQFFPAIGFTMHGIVARKELVNA